ncbi:uncharacterized protein LOC135684141 [Rhopilema esculentum]|uniref:uncharacterized protein LOC135684141 n=1 Tax=Rhopilema esculentum TaxID=499914 RepID=UPI0031CDE3C0
MAFFSQALTEIMSYDPSFKVETRLHEPLWKNYRSFEEIAVEILSLAAQLEGMCKERYTKSSGGIASDYRKEYLNKFEPLASVFVGKMEEYLQFMPNPRPTLKEYFKQSGLVTLFPKTASYIINPQRPMFKNQKSTMDGYFAHLSIMNQLLRLATQINCDVNNLGNHKYIAHQIALLYQAVNQAGPSLAAIKKQVEDNFQNIKECLSSQNKDGILKLPLVQKEWVNFVTGDIYNAVTSLESQIAQPLQPSIQFLRQNGQACH